MSSPGSTQAGQGYLAEIAACSDKLQQQLQRMQNPREAAKVASQIQHLSREISQRYG